MKTKWYLGRRLDDNKKVFLEDFSWECDWYWGGGYVGNSEFHCHFDGCFLKVPDSRGHSLGAFYDPWTKIPDYVSKDRVKIIQNGASIWEPLSFFLNDAQYDEKQWWRIKDMFKQFYVLQKAAEVFRHGGHCSSSRTEGEIVPEMAEKINKHIETVIIPCVRKELNKET